MIDIFFQCASVLHVLTVQILQLIQDKIIHVTCPSFVPKILQLPEPQFIETSWFASLQLYFSTSNNWIGKLFAWFGTANNAKPQPSITVQAVVNDHKFCYWFDAIPNYVSAYRISYFILQLFILSFVLYNFFFLLECALVQFWPRYRTKNHEIQRKVTILLGVTLVMLVLCASPMWIETVYTLIHEPNISLMQPLLQVSILCSSIYFLSLCMLRNMSWMSVVRCGLNLSILIVVSGLDFISIDVLRMLFVYGSVSTLSGFFRDFHHALLSVYHTLPQHFNVFILIVNTVAIVCKMWVQINWFTWTIFEAFQTNNNVQLCISSAYMILLSITLFRADVVDVLHLRKLLKVEKNDSPMQQVIEGIAQVKNQES